MFSLLSRLLTIVALGMFFVACQCVPGLDTEQDITPSQYSRVLCVNCVPNQKVGVLVGNKRLHSALNYDMEEGFRYQNVSPGLSNFSIYLKNDSIVYNAFAELKKGYSYSFFIYPLNKRIQSILLSDTISNYSRSNSYFRFVHLASTSSPTFLFQVEDQYPISIGLSFRLFSKFLTTYPGNYKISISDPEKDSTLFQLFNYPFKPGKGYSIVLRGYEKSIDPGSSLKLLIIEHNFDDIFDSNLIKFNLP